MPNRSDLVAFLVVVAWVAASGALIVANSAPSPSDVPMFVTDTILWPNAMTSGSLFAILLLLSARPEPTPPMMASAIVAGSAIGLAVLWGTTEFEFALFSMICAAAFVLLFATIRSRRAPDALAVLPICAVAVYGFLVLVEHRMLLFPFFEAMQEQRLAAITEAVGSPSPADHPLCANPAVLCFPEGLQVPFAATDRDLETLADLASHAPYKAVTAVLDTNGAVNPMTDRTYVAARAVEDRTMFVVSLPDHMIEWRALAARFVIVWSSTAFLVISVALVGAGWLLRSGRARRMVSRPAQG